MRAGLTVLIAFVGVCAERSRARADEDPASPILIHPGVVTVLEFPDAIVHTWLDHHGDIRVAPIRDKLYVRPRPGTPAGVEAWLEVQTRTLHRTFRLLVVARASDARQDVLVEAVDVQSREESKPEIPAELAAPLALPAGPVVPPPVVTPDVAAPAASTPTRAASPVPPEPVAGPEDASSTAVVPKVLGPPRAEISVHAIGALGFAALDIAGYEPWIARQPYVGLGAGLRVARADAWWAVEASVSGERFGGPVTFVESENRLPPLAMDGTWLNAEVHVRARFGTKWSPSVYAGFGLQAHLRWTEGMRDGPAFSETMPHGAVLVLGIGLQRRVGDLLLGLDVQVRQGGPDGYHSAALLWTIGRFLDPD